MSRDLTGRIVTWIAILLLGFSLGVAVTLAVQPDCPTEDSCTADYRDGGWRIEETTP